MEGSGRGLLKILSRQLCGANVENPRESNFMVADVPIWILTGHFLITS